MPAPMTKTEFAELLKIGNDQLAATVRSHVQAARTEMSRSLEELSERLDSLEAWQKRRAEYAAYKAYNRPKLYDGVEIDPTPREAWD